MSSLNDGVLSAIGNTPLVRLDRALPEGRFRLFAKLEALNPGGSMKDRPAVEMIRRALEAGVIGPGSVIVESSSGNMAIGLAQACRFHGLSLICVVDPKTTPQHLALLRAYGVGVEMVREATSTGDYLEARLARVHSLLRTVPNSYWPDQYSNPWNAASHASHTMPEIVRQLGEPVDYLFCSTSTCGTIMGCADYIRRTGLRTRVIAVDAIGSAIFGGVKARRLIPGHGAALKPKLCNDELVDRVVHVSDVECIRACRALVRREAILAGGSTGAVMAAIARMRYAIPDGAVCAAIFADRGERYLTTIYSDEWVAEHFGDVLSAAGPWPDDAPHEPEPVSLHAVPVGQS